LSQKRETLEAAEMRESENMDSLGDGKEEDIPQVIGKKDRKTGSGSENSETRRFELTVALEREEKSLEDVIG